MEEIYFWLNKRRNTIFDCLFLHWYNIIVLKSFQVAKHEFVHNNDARGLYYRIHSQLFQVVLSFGQIRKHQNFCHYARRRYFTFSGPGRSHHWSREGWNFWPNDRQSGWGEIIDILEKISKCAQNWPHKT